MKCSFNMCYHPCSIFQFSFIQEDDNFPKYEDEIDLYKTYDISAYVTSIKKGMF